MSKPRKERIVAALPPVAYFKPQGIPLVSLEHVNLTLDEYEAIRLCDLEKLNHDESSRYMKISRPTFTRLLEEAHGKIADVLVSGKSLKIEGGRYQLACKRGRRGT